MRLLYLILKVTLPIAMRIQFKRVVHLRRPKKFRTSTIYASNHPSSFMDPLSISVLNNPIVYFMVRADVFKAWLVPIFSSAQMIPVYREHDGGKAALEKNEESFARAQSVLGIKKGLIIFAEGFTDDVFIRRLKPIKKGPARIAIGAMERFNWEKEIYLQCVGLNYSDPGSMRSDLVVCYGEKVSLNEFKKLYDENPNKAINHITKFIRTHLKKQITHVENKDIAPFHEQIMRLTRKGMNLHDSDKSIPLEERFKYSRALADQINKVDFEEESEWVQLKDDVHSYFKEIESKGIEERHVYSYSKSGKKLSTLKENFQRILSFPIMLVALIHCAPIYFFVKRFVEKNFKRKVFWSSVKMVMGMILLGFYNIILAVLFYHFIFPDIWVTLAYYFVVTPLSGVITYDWMMLNSKEIAAKNKFNNISDQEKKELKEKRQSLIDRLYALGVK